MLQNIVCRQHEYSLLKAKATITVTGLLHLLENALSRMERHLNIVLTKFTAVLLLGIMRRTLENPNDWKESTKR